MEVTEEGTATAPAVAAPARRRSSTRRFVFTFLLLAAVTFAVLRLVPSGDYVYLPHKARAVDPLITVPSEQAESESASGNAGIYMVDILVRKATLFERLFPGLQEGAELVPAERLNPEGVSEDQRTRRADAQMATSREISAAVALRALGYDVPVTEIGTQVELVTPSSDAYGKLQPGDVIVRANGKEIRNRQQLFDALTGVTPGSAVTVAVRDGASQEEFTFDTRPDRQDPERAVIGIQVSDAASVDLPIDVEIDAGNVGGPSAGLAFALDIVDELGTEVDQGRTIVVTGEIALDGSVGPIGGMHQKTIGALKSGADVIVVPEDNAAEARRYAGDVPVLAVDTFDEALQELGVTLPAASS